MMKEGRAFALNSIEYRRMHRAVKRARGYAEGWDCFFCIVKHGRDWAQIHSTSGLELIHYVPACRQCHSDYDDNGRYERTEKVKQAISIANKGNEYWLGKRHTEDTKAKMSASQAKAAPERKRDAFGRWAVS
jgi:NUMOD3 motif